MANAPVVVDHKLEQPRQTDETRSRSVALEVDSRTTSPSTSNHHEALDQRSAFGVCKACKTDFAQFYNGWQQITGSYYLPTCAGESRAPGLQAKSKPKLASPNSALEGCTIQPLVCNNCDDTLAIICIKAPENKSAYAEREFFKLPKIQLRSESTGKSVDPIIEGDHRPASPKGRQALEATNMEQTGEAAVVTVQKPLLPSMSVLGHKSLVEGDRNELSSVRAVPAQPLHPKPMLARQSPHPPPQATLPSQQRPTPVPQQLSTMGPAHSTVTRANGVGANVQSQPYLEARVGAIDRLQAQVSINTQAIEMCGNDLHRLEGSFRQIQAEFRHTVDTLRAELHAIRRQPAGVPASPVERVDDQSLEVFANTLSQVVAKSNDVDQLRVQFEVIKRRLQRLEESNSSPTGVTPGYPPHRRETSLHRPPVAQHTPHLPSQPGLPLGEPRLLPSQPAQPPTYTPEPVPQSRQVSHEQVPAASWTSVNTGVKRPLRAGDGHEEAAGTPMGSPKRAKLAPLEPRYAYEAQVPSQTPAHYERMDTEDSAPSQGYHGPTQASYPEATHPSTFAPYSQDAGSDPSWQPESQRAVSNSSLTGTSPRGRGRGRGRGGRPRKSMPLEPHIIATPEWEKESWTGSQIDQDRYYRGVVARRGSGGAPGITMTPIQAIDPYGHTKRSRTKPIRNSDGVLIRKDGRPDMRSQSSAANLRKVHAKKEEERLSLGGVPAAAGVDARSVADSPVSTDSHDVEPSNAQERSAHIMQQMFPKGIEQERARLYTTQQYFPSDRSQADTVSSTPAQRAVSESAPAVSDETEKTRGDSPQQHDEAMEDQPLEDTAAAEPLATEANPLPAPSNEVPDAQSEKQDISIMETPEATASAPTISTATVLST